jgi:hypothetical protein
MYSFLAYFFSLFVIVISVFTTLFVKNELERLFREKDVLPFHICNVVWLSHLFVHSLKLWLTISICCSGLKPF